MTAIYVVVHHENDHSIFLSLLPTERSSQSFHAGAGGRRRGKKQPYKLKSGSFEMRLKLHRSVSCRSTPPPPPLSLLPLPPPSFSSPFRFFLPHTIIFFFLPLPSILFLSILFSSFFYSLTPSFLPVPLSQPLHPSALSLYRLLLLAPPSIGFSHSMHSLPLFFCGLPLASPSPLPALPPHPSFSLCPLTPHSASRLIPVQTNGQSRKVRSVGRDVFSRTPRGF